MKTRIYRALGYAAVILVALGALGYAFRDGATSGPAPGLIGPAMDEPRSTDLMAQIDMALGTNIAPAEKDSARAVSPNSGSAGSMARPEQTAPPGTDPMALGTSE